MTMTTQDAIGLAIVLAVLICLVLMQVYSNAHRREVEVRQARQKRRDNFSEIYTTLMMDPKSGDTDIITRRQEGEE